MAPRSRIDWITLIIGVTDTRAVCERCGSSVRIPHRPDDDEPDPLVAFQNAHARCEQRSAVGRKEPQP